MDVVELVVVDPVFFCVVDFETAVWRDAVVLSWLGGLVVSWIGELTILAGWDFGFGVGTQERDEFCAKRSIGGRRSIRRRCGR